VTESTAPDVAPAPGGKTFLERLLDGVERAGNKMPHPAILFLGLSAAVIVVSQILYWAGVKATFEVVTPPAVPTQETYYGGSSEPMDVGPTVPEPAKAYTVETETAKVKGLLTGEGVRYLFTSFVSNFRNFSAVTIMLVVMIGVGLAEAAGLVSSLIRKLVAVSPGGTLTFIIVLLGILSSVASDAGYLVLIPLGAAAFKSVGRNPLAGIAAAFAGVAAGFGVNILITPLDGVLTEITNDAAGSNAGHHIDLAANLYFGIGSTIFVAFLLTFISARLVERRLGVYHPEDHGAGWAMDEEEAPQVTPEADAKGLRWALWGTVVVVAAVTLLTAIPGAPLRNPDTGKVIGDSPFMDSLIVIIMVIFYVAGYLYGRGAGTIKGSADVIETITKSWAGLASLLFLFLLIAQFIAYFNFSNIAEVVAVKLGDVLERLNIGAVWLLIGLIIVTIIVDLIIPAAIAKWALLAPIFVPLFIRLGVAPQTVLAAYRVGDSPANVITPLMAYFPLIVVFTQRYKKNAGIGTVVSLMLPYVVILSVVWTLFFVLWYVIGIPLGPGSPVHTK
jgi:aminobenzoyl-glutamate transport protein